MLRRRREVLHAGREVLRRARPRIAASTKGTTPRQAPRATSAARRSPRNDDSGRVDAFAQRVADRLGAIVRAELVEDVAYVKLDRVLAQVQSPGEASRHNICCASANGRIRRKPAHSAMTDERSERKRAPAGTAPGARASDIHPQWRERNRLEPMNFESAVEGDHVATCPYNSSCSISPALNLGAYFLKP